MRRPDFPGCFNNLPGLNFSALSAADLAMKDATFRKGIIVPEPPSGSLILLAIGVLVWRCRRQQLPHALTTGDLRGQVLQMPEPSFLPCLVREFY